MKRWEYLMAQAVSGEGGNTAWRLWHCDLDVSEAPKGHGSIQGLESLLTQQGGLGWEYVGGVGLTKVLVFKREKQ